MKRILIVISAIIATSSAIYADKKDDQLRERLKALTQQYDSLKQVHQQDSIQQDLLKHRCDSLQEELEALRTFRNEFVKDKLINEGPKTDALFSQVTIGQLLAHSSKLKQFEADPTVADYLKKFTVFTEMKVRFDQYENLLKSPFSRVGVGDAFKDITTKLKEEEGRSLTEAQYQEFYQVATYLSRYYQGGKDFQQLIKDIKDKLKNYEGNTDKDTRDFCASLAIQVFVSRQADIDKRIMNIPYLKERFIIYKENMENNPLSLKPETQKAINEINSLILD